MALVVGAIAVPLANATRYDGYKSGYPQLHQVLSGAVSGMGKYDGYKSSYPQLHAALSHQVRAPLVRTVKGGFDWRDAAVGAGTSAIAIFLLAGGAIFLMRRHTKLAL
jgi:hypothetical protein